MGRKGKKKTSKPAQVNQDFTSISDIERSPGAAGGSPRSKELDPLSGQDTANPTSPWSGGSNGELDWASSSLVRDEEGGGWSSAPSSPSSSLSSSSSDLSPQSKLERFQKTQQVVRKMLDKKLSELTCPFQGEYQKIEMSSCFNKRWTPSPEGSRYAPLSVKTSVAGDGTKTLTGPVVIDTPADGWCLMHSVVGSMNIQLRPQPKVELSTLCTRLYDHLIENMSNLSELILETPGSFYRKVVRYFLCNDFNSEIVDIFPFLISKVMEVNIEIVDRTNKMKVRTENDASWPYIVIDRTGLHYSTVVVAENAPVEAVLGLNTAEFAQPLPLESFDLAQGSKNKKHKKNKKRK